ncbi:hypothetical protein [Microcystis phage MaeS]|nr:hypothetical protein [Microcystis phage MaeS]
MSISKICPCGESFTSKSNGAKYCSEGCRKEGLRSSWRKSAANNRGYKREVSKRHYEQNKEELIKKSTKYQKTEKGREIRRNKAKRYNEKYPEKVRARQEVRNALRRGDLVKEPCEKCGETKVEAHHENYHEPLEVVWLCKKCHDNETRKVDE